MESGGRNVFVLSFIKSFNFYRFSFRKLKLFRANFYYLLCVDMYAMKLRREKETARKKFKHHLSFDMVFIVFFLIALLLAYLMHVIFTKRDCLLFSLLLLPFIFNHA